MLRILTASLLSTLPLAAQGEILHYTFDATDATRTLNHARGPGAGPEFGTISSPTTSFYSDGRFGGGLRHGPYVGLPGNWVDTGWSAGHSGALTIAFFLRNALANSIAEYSPFAGQQNWSIASGGSAGPGLQLHGWGGPDLNGDFGVALCSMPGWNHFAIVIDPAAGTAAWYRNGALATTTAISGGASLAAGSELRCGTDYVTTCGSLYDMDEFRLLGRAAMAAEIARWATRPVAVTVAFGAANPAARLTAVGVPAIANTSFALDLAGTASAAWVLTLGRSYARFGTLDLPVDLSTILPVPAGQMLQVAPVMLATGALGIDGEARQPLPIPADPALASAAVYAQILTLSPAGALSAGNALAIRVGE